MRMPQERWPAKIHAWIPPGRRKRRDGVTEAMEKITALCNGQLYSEKQTGRTCTCRLGLTVV
jgi:hypothetical protein